MKIIDAFWEQRNMGVIEGSESLDEIRATLSGLQTEYIVVKAPVGRLDINSLLSGLGFSFMETMLQIEHSTENIVYHSQRLKDAVESISFIPIKTIDRVCENIQKGMFTTDRVALDPFFTQKQAIDRYIGWINDEFSRGTHFFEYYHGDSVIGFICVRPADENKISYAVFSGLYPTENRFSPGSAIMYKQLDVARSVGAEKLMTYISTNNTAVVHIDTQCGFIVKDTKYIFVKHQVLQ